MGCVACKSGSRRSTFQSEYYERVQRNQVEEDRKFDIQKNPIMLRRAKSHSQTPIKENRTKTPSELPQIQLPKN